MSADNPPAFPTPTGIKDVSRLWGGQHQTHPIITDAGMSLRDWFAGQALAGMLSHSSAVGIDGPTSDIVAGAAFQFADAMLAERATGGAA